jgi:hypothetical protein
MKLVHYADVFLRMTLKRGKLTRWEEVTARCKDTRVKNADTRWSNVTCPACLAMRRTKKDKE